MKVKLVEKLLKEGVSKDEIYNILKLIGEAHDKIIEAQDYVDSLSSDYDDDILGDLEMYIDDMEASISELDFMGEEDPVSAIYKFYEIEEDN